MMHTGPREQLRRRLYLAAHQEVSALIAELPRPIRERTRHVAILYEMKPGPVELKDGIANDTLGLFSGESMADEIGSHGGRPTEITLFMENIWDYAGHDAATYREEVRRTYLHELGHYLGLDEDALVDRDLD